MVGVVNKVAVMAKIAVATKIFKEEEKMVEMEHKVVEVVVMVVIRNIFMKFWLIIR